MALNSRKVNGSLSALELGRKQASTAYINAEIDQFMMSDVVFYRHEKIKRIYFYLNFSQIFW